MKTVLEHESELEFELGGPAYRLMQRIGLIEGAGPSLGRRVAGVDVRAGEAHAG